MPAQHHLLACLQLLSVLPSLPSLTHLALGDVGSAHSLARSMQPAAPLGAVAAASSTDAGTIVGARELMQLQGCARLTHLEMHTLR